jgi:hypothetical protein
VAVRVDEPGKDDAACDVDDLGVSGVEVRADGFDGAVGRDEDVGSGEDFTGLGGRDDGAAAEQGACAHGRR